jgi:hypothetical protein
MRRARLLCKNSLKARRGDNSFAGEFAHLSLLTAQLAINDGYLGDIAASDGVTQSCTLGFFSRPSWLWLAVEMNGDKFASPDVRLAKCRVTPRNVVALRLGNEVPSDFAILNLDIDSYDLELIDQMLQGGFRPEIISMAARSRAADQNRARVLEPSVARRWNSSRNRAITRLGSPRKNSSLPV